ncbi:MAG: hypothetical protein CBC67_02650 [Gammaproteobacteria bacterium TMED107]|nr:MAG: hypothetical protein CBC67_02650 [Gammaproteobacteria bacterium TMED107]
MQDTGSYARFKTGKMTQDKRVIQEALSARSAIDGAGVRLKRVYGGRDLDRFDPFLMLDEFGSFDVANYHSRKLV